jgi:hypothetical protein
VDVKAMAYLLETHAVTQQAVEELKKAQVLVACRVPEAQVLASRSE